MKRNQRNASKRVVRSPLPASTARSRRPAPTFAYAEVESALVEVFDVGDARQGTFRARLQNFRKLGIPAKNPGKGQRLRYAPTDLFQLLLALELTEYGLDPALVVKTIRDDWSNQSGFFAAIRSATQLPPPSKDIYAVMHMSVLSASLGPRGIVSTNEGLSVRSAPNAITVKFTWGDADFTQLLQDPDFIRLLQEPRARLSWFNLSDRIRAIREALAI
jgi:hypothetical protein